MAAGLFWGGERQVRGRIVAPGQGACPRGGLVRSTSRLAQA